MCVFGELKNCAHELTMLFSLFFLFFVRFLKPCLYPALSSVNESAQVAAMSYTSMMLEVLHNTAPSSPMVALLARFLLGLQIDKEMEGTVNGENSFGKMY